MIDADGFRPNVGIVLANPQGRVLWARRVGGRDAWQFPQGGIHDRESAEAALYRELHEEVGLQPEHVEILSCTRGWLRYRLPRHLIRRQAQPVCIGQKQKWYLLKLVAPEQRIQLDKHDTAEFDCWRWVNYWYPLTGVVAFKREVYRRALKELSARVSQLQQASVSCDLPRDFSCEQGGGR